jgi:hypothetical protein
MVRENGSGLGIGSRSLLRQRGYTATEVGLHAIGTCQRQRLSDVSDVVALPDTCSPVHHPKRAVLVRAELNPMCGAFIEISDLFVHEVLFTGTRGAM